MSTRGTLVTALAAACVLAVSTVTAIVGVGTATPAASLSASTAPRPATRVTVPAAISHCSPRTIAHESGASATVIAHAAQAGAGQLGGYGYSIWSADGKAGAAGLEDGGLLVDGRAYGMCPGFHNPAELEMIDIGPQALVYGVVGYPGLATVSLYSSTAGTFDRGTQLPAPRVAVVRGVSYFIGLLPRSACDYPSLELNTTSPGVSAEHNLSFRTCTKDTQGKLVTITGSQGVWQLPPGQFLLRPPASSASPVTAAVAGCFPKTSPAMSGGPAATITAHATEAASGTIAGHTWSLWTANGKKHALALEDAGLLIDGKSYGLCPGFTNPAELEMADIGSKAIVYGVIDYAGPATIHLYRGRPRSFKPGKGLPAPAVLAVRGVSFFIGALPSFACDYPWLELNATAGQRAARHNLGFGACTPGQVVPITSSKAKQIRAAKP